jgi:hypothetical protein
VKQLRRDRRKPESGKAVCDITYVCVNAKDLGKYHNPAPGFLARRLCQPREHCCSVINFDFDVL